VDEVAAADAYRLIIVFNALVFRRNTARRRTIRIQSGCNGALWRFNRFFTGAICFFDCRHNLPFLRRGTGPRNTDEIFSLQPRPPKWRTAGAIQRPHRRLSNQLPTGNLVANVANDASLVAFCETNGN
jgi:hypothetical protein